MALTDDAAVAIGKAEAAAVRAAAWTERNESSPNAWAAVAIAWAAIAAVYQSAAGPAVDAPRVRTASGRNFNAAAPTTYDGGTYLVDDEDTDT